MQARTSVNTNATQEGGAVTLVKTVAGMLRAAREMPGGVAEVEARLGTWSVGGAFVPGIHLRALGGVQRNLDSFPNWDVVTGWRSTRDVFCGADGKSVRCELRAGEDGEPPQLVQTWKKKFSQADALVWPPAQPAPAKKTAAKASANDQRPLPDEASRYGIRFALAAEEPACLPPGQVEKEVALVRYKRRRSWLWGPLRYDLTLVWAGESRKATDPAYLGEGGGLPTPSESAEAQLASGIPTSIELEVEFDVRHPACASLFDNDPDKMASAFVKSVAGVVCANSKAAFRYETRS
jgi:hypothetical protein